MFNSYWLSSSVYHVVVSQTKGLICCHVSRWAWTWEDRQKEVPKSQKKMVGISLDQGGSKLYISKLDENGKATWLIATCGLAVYNHWTGLLEWTTGLTFFALKIIFMPSNKICLPVELHPTLI